tara:strand:+ start:209 stop:424 length:216 start_codon:yes stop_codon:yes gene_type:complete
MAGYSNHGYIGFNSSGGPVGVIRQSDMYIRTGDNAIPLPDGAFDVKEEAFQSTLQAATLVFLNTKQDGPKV